MINSEEKSEIYSKKKYIEISKEIIQSRNLINNWLLKKKISEKGYKCFGYGASATGTVLSRMLSLDVFFSGIIDDNKSRQGLLSPNSFLPIISLNSLKNEKKIIIIILAWRYKDKILKKIKNFFNNKAIVIAAKPHIRKIIEL